MGWFGSITVHTLISRVESNAVLWMVARSEKAGSLGQESRLVLVAK